MSDESEIRDLDAVLNRIGKGWRELAEFLRQNQPASRVIEAEKIVLVDAEGSVRGKLGVNEDGSSGLMLMDKGGKHRAWLGLTEDGSAYLSLRDKFGRLCYEMSEDTGLPKATPELPQEPSVETKNTLGAGAPNSQAILGRLSQMEETLASIKLTLDGGRVGQVREIPEAGVAREIETFKELPGRPAGESDRWKYIGFGGLALGVVIVVLLGLLISTAQWRGSVTKESSAISELRQKSEEGAGPSDLKGKMQAGPASETEGKSDLAMGNKIQPELAEPQAKPEGEPRSTLQKEPGKPPAAAAVVFEANPAGKAYHYPSCTWVKNIPKENLRKFSSAAEAKKAGYRPCRTCNPPSN